MHLHISPSTALWFLSVLVFITAIYQHLQWRLLVSAAAAKATLGADWRFLHTQAEAPTASEVPVDCSTNLLIIVPAHNEEKLLPACLESLKHSTLSPERYRVLVAADNCTDGTEAKANSAGASLAVRKQPERIGKAWLLHDLFETLLNADDSVQIPQEIHEFPWQAAVIVDADCIVHPELLAHFARRLEDGELAIQGCYSILNPETNWRTRLMCCALCLVHFIKPLGRERLEFSETLKGSGMCLDRSVLHVLPWNGEALAEDLEYSLRLIEKGYRIAFEPRAQLWSPMAASSQAASNQRRRWEGGRFRLILKAPGLYRTGLYCKDRKLKERAWDLITPPLAELTLLNIVVAVATAAAALHYKTELSQAISGASVSILIIHFLFVVMALSLAQIPRSISRALFFAPVYMLWKLAVKITGPVFRPLKRWERTER